MNKKTIISKTAIFLFVIVFVVIFKSIFGSDNTLIGVTTITAMLMFLSRDLTVSPIKNTLKLIGTNLLIGVGTSLIATNIWLGIVLNFVVVFIVAYSYCYNLRNPLYVPFLLQYEFLVSKPVPADELGIRFLALIVGAIIIMLPQFIVNRNRLTKSGNKILSSVCENILGKIHNIQQSDNINKDNEDSINEVNLRLDQFREMIYDKRDSEYYLTEEAKVKLSISVALEGINLALCKGNKNNIDKLTLETLNKLIKETKNILEINSKNKKYEKVSYNLKELIDYFDKEDISDLYNLQLLDSMIVLSKSINSLKELDIKEYNLVKKVEEIPDLFSKESIRSEFIGRKSLKFCYAMRLAITTGIGLFIMYYFKIVEARWIMFTVISVTTPIYETSKDKIKDRVFATLIGSLIVFILFSVVKNETARLLLVMLTGYLQGYVQKYRYNMIFVTVSAVGAAAVAGNIDSVTLDRILFVLIGTIIAVLANRYLFPYKIQDSNQELKTMYNKAMKSMLDEIKHLAEGLKRPQVIKNLFVSLTLIESKLRMNAQVSSNPYYKQIIRERRNLINSVYELYMWMLSENISTEHKKIIIEDAVNLVEYNMNPSEENLLYLENKIKESKNIDIRIILSNMLIILNEMNKIEKISAKAKL